MTKKELELIASFTALEVAMNSLTTKQSVAEANFTSNGLTVNYYKNDIRAIEKQLKETKDKFYEILSDVE